MAFEGSNVSNNNWQPPVDATQARIAQAQATLPSSNADSSGAEPTQSSPTGDQLQAPAARPAAQPMQLQPSVTTPAVPPSSNQRLHGFIGSVLSGTLRALAGPPDTQYTTDSSGRVIKDPNQPKDSTGKQLARLAMHGFEGLAAGTNAPPQKSGLATGLAGLAAGANAQTLNANARDRAAQQKARENDEAAQQKILRMHDIARGNMLMASTWQHLMDTEQDRDPARQQHLDWAKAAEDAGVAVRYVNEDEANQLRQSDPYAAAKFQVLPVGMKMVTDEQGQPVLDSDGKPHYKGQFALIDGLHEGNIPAPATFVSDLKKYGKYAGVMEGDTLNSGDDLSMQHFIKLANAIQEGKKKELQGWATAKPAWGGADGKTAGELNTTTGEFRAYPAGVTPNVKNEPAESAANIKEKEALTKKANEDAAAKAQEIQNLKSIGVNVPANYQPPSNVFSLKPSDLRADMASKGVQVPGNLDTLYAVGHYKQDPKTFATQLRKGVPGMTRDQAVSFIHQFVNPNYDDKSYEAVKKMELGFADDKAGAPGGTLTSFNTATGHLKQLYDAGKALQNGDIQALNKIANIYGVQTGNSAPVVFDAIRVALVGELGKTFKGAAADVPEAQEIKQAISNAQGPKQLQDVAKTYAHLMLTKGKAMGAHYYAYTGEYPPALMTDDSRKAYQAMGIDVSDINGGSPVGTFGNANPGSPQSGQPATNDPFAKFGGKSRQ